MPPARRGLKPAAYDPDLKAEAQAGVPLALKIGTARLRRAILPKAAFRHSA